MMTPTEYDRSVTGQRAAAEIAERYDRAVIVWDVGHGRDRGGLLPAQRIRFSAWQKCGCDAFAALCLLLEEADQKIGG